MGCVLSRSSRKKVGYHWAVQEKGGTGVGWAEGEKEREEVGEEVEERKKDMYESKDREAYILMQARNIKLDDLLKLFSQAN